MDSENRISLNYPKMSTSDYIRKIFISKFRPHNTFKHRNVKHVFMYDKINTLFLIRDINQVKLSLARFLGFQEAEASRIPEFQKIGT